MGVTAKSQEKLALVIAAAVEGELVRLIDCTDLELFTLCERKMREMSEQTVEMIKYIVGFYI